MLTLLVGINMLTFVILALATTTASTSSAGVMTAIEELPITPGHTCE